MDLSPESVSAEIRQLLGSLNKENYNSVIQQLSEYIEFTEEPATSLQLSACDKLCFGLVLSDSDDSDEKMIGIDFCMSQCEELCAIPDSSDATVLSKSVDCILQALQFLEQSEVFSKHLDSIMQMMVQVWLNDNTCSILSENEHDRKLDSEVEFQIQEHVEIENETRVLLFARMLGMTAPGISFVIIVENFGQKDFNFVLMSGNKWFYMDQHVFVHVGTKHFLILMTKEDPFPVAAVCCNIWENTAAQMLFLKHAMSATPDVFTFADSSTRPEDEDAVNGHYFQANQAVQPLFCLDLLEVLCELAEKGHATSVRSLLEFYLRNFPEVLLLGMARVITTSNLIQREVSSTVLPLLIKDASNNGIILQFLYANPLLFSRAVDDILRHEPLNVNRFVDVFYELEILLYVLDLVPISLGIRLAAIASQKEFIDLTQWLSSNLDESKDELFEECSKFLKEVEENTGEIWNLYKETAPVVSKFLRACTCISSDQLSEQMKSLYVMSTLNSPQKESIEYPDTSKSEVNDKHTNTGEIWNVYKETAPVVPKACAHISTDQLSEQMKNLYVTSTHNSPQKDCIGHPNTSKSEVCDNHINIEMPVSSSCLSGHDGAYLDSKVNSPIQLEQRTEGSRETNQNVSTSRQVPVASAASFGSITNETLTAASKNRETPIEVPPLEIQDKILFVTNVLSTANIDSKANEFKEILETKFYPWFANYLVVTRASMEPNLHMLYISFLQKCNIKHLTKEIIHETYENCKVLLRSELLKTSAEERKLLKNLGGWLGKLTIGRNHVLLAKHVDPKSLIVEGYEKGLMIGVIPFISKILESCKHSLAYQPPNPWTMGILELLAEVYAMPNLKLYLKFEIEVLFKNLDVDIKSVCPTSLLNNRARIIEGNPDFSQQVNHAISSVRSSVNQVELSPEAVRLSYQSGLLNTSYQRPGQLHLSAITLGVPDNQLSSAQGLPVAQNPYVLPAPELNAPQFQCSFLITHMRSVLSMAMEKAVEKLLSTVVKRIVSIATQTTINLVLKDYVTDPHDNSIHSASSFMIAQLAGNLSYVTCKERLRSQMSTQLRNSLLGLNISSEYLEPVMQQVINENLDLGCASIEKAAMEEGLILVRRELIRHLTKINISATPEEFDIKSGQLYLPGS